MASNPWLSEYFNSRTGCNTSDLTCWRKSLEAFSGLQLTGDLMFEYYQVKATAILILALKKLHSSLCLIAGVCNELIHLLANRRSAVMGEAGCPVCKTVGFNVAITMLCILLCHSLMLLASYMVLYYLLGFALHVHLTMNNCIHYCLSMLQQTMLCGIYL